jgi:PDZ domain-containing secreted protein
MAKIGEDTEITLDLKTIVMVVAFLGTIIGMWFTLQKDIELAKELPEPNISRTEYDLKDQMVRDAIMRTQEQVEEIGKDVKVIDERLFEIQQKQK